MLACLSPNAVPFHHVDVSLLQRVGVVAGPGETCTRRETKLHGDVARGMPRIGCVVGGSVGGDGASQMRHGHHGRACKQQQDARRSCHRLGGRGHRRRSRVGGWTMAWRAPAEAFGSRARVPAARSRRQSASRRAQEGVRRTAGHGGSRLASEVVRHRGIGAAATCVFESREQPQGRDEALGACVRGGLHVLSHRRVLGLVGNCATRRTAAGFAR
mmetsp:Transcript_794/g.4961  ORF Transcript_794/g.4961 Transcript_794/m.4961 type:complete len:215 (-) Transcript_794:1231-1875(-)